MYNRSMLYTLSRFYFLKKGIYKHIKIEMIKICIKCLVLYTNYSKFYSSKQQIFVILYNF